MQLVKVRCVLLRGAFWGERPHVLKGRKLEGRGNLEKMLLAAVKTTTEVAASNSVYTVSETYKGEPSIRPPSCLIPRQPTINDTSFQ